MTLCFIQHPHSPYPSYTTLLHPLAHHNYPAFSPLQAAALVEREGGLVDGKPLPGGQQLSWEDAQHVDFGSHGRAAGDWNLEQLKDQLRLSNLEAAERSPELFASLQRHLRDSGDRPLLKARDGPLPLGGNRAAVLARLLAVLEAEREASGNAKATEEPD